MEFERCSLPNHQITYQSQPHMKNQGLKTFQMNQFVISTKLLLRPILVTQIKSLDENAGVVHWL